MGKKNIKSIKIASICLVTVLMASLFLIAGVSGTDTDPILPPTEDNIISDAENDTLQPSDDDRTAYDENDERWSEEPSSPTRTENKDTAGEIYGPSGTRIGVYGAQLAYFSDKSDVNVPWFIPSAIVDCESGWYPHTIKMTVSAKYPNGTSVPSMFLSPNGHIVSGDPSMGSSQMYGALKNVINIIGAAIPGVNIVMALASGTTNNGDPLAGWEFEERSNSATAIGEYKQLTFFLPPPTTRGVQLWTDLRCDEQAPGVYIVTVRYDVTLTSISVGTPVQTTFSQEAYYEYQPKAKVYAGTVVQDNTATGGGAFVRNPSLMQGDHPDTQFGDINSGGFGYHATALVTMTPNTGVSGHIYMYGKSMVTSGGSHVYVYRSDSLSGPWSLVKEMYVNKNTEHYIDCGKSDISFKYLAIACYYDNRMSWIYIDSISVTKY